MTRYTPRADGRWLVVGARGMLGRDVVRVLADSDVVAMGRDELDVTDLTAVADAVHGVDVVVNCAAWTDVDGAEAREGEAFAVNAVAPSLLAGACAAASAWLVHISTDYVFDGEASSPYVEEAPLRPRSAYGRTKAAGEWAVRATAPERSYVLRTSWLYGQDGGNFVRTMARLEAERDTVDVVDDQRGQPTWSLDVARRLVLAVDSGIPAGTYHATDAGEATWFTLARRVFELCGADPERVRRTTTAAFPRPAPRPSYSALGHAAWGRAGLPPMRDWREALDDAWPVLAPAPQGG